MEQITTIGLDLAKNVFQVHGADAAGRMLVRKQLRRAEVLRFFSALPACLVGMEACGNALINIVRWRTKRSRTLCNRAASTRARRRTGGRIERVWRPAPPPRWRWPLSGLSLDSAPNANWPHWRDATP